MRALPEIKDSWTKSFYDNFQLGFGITEPCYVGIDPSLSAFSIVAVNKNGHFGNLIKVPPTLNMGARLVVYQTLIEGFLRLLPTKPEQVVVEGPGYGGHATSAWALGGLNGALLQALWWAECDDRSIALQPSTLKKYVTNNGNAKKNTMMREVFKVWEFDALDDNCADAYALAQAAMTICTSTAKYAWQLAVLKKQIDARAEQGPPVDRLREPPARRVVRRRPAAPEGRR